ncbi:PBCV-specific basic adaptor domain-containing protein [Acanthocystis turfacea Chlorella virus GM0701.1]|nr:PBCV-specific basic adaptor domain-containing protein [Acanthocystis turfacea Chlorella virus GM0701.1]
MSAKFKFPQIKIIPTVDGFLRGERVSDLSIKTVSPPEFGTQAVDDAWLAKQAAFMMKLDDHDLYTVVSYTSRSHQWITPFMRTGKLPGKKELKNIVQDDMLTPLFVQMTTLVSRGVQMYGKKTIDKEMFTDDAHRKYVRDLFLDPATPLDTRYLAFKMLLRGDDFSDRVVKMALTLYVSDLKRIMRVAPPVSSDLTVFRGTLMNIVQKKDEIVSKEYTSATLSLQYSLAYSTNRENSTKGRIMRIVVPKGNKCLALCIVNPFGPVGEFEVLLPPGSFKVLETNVRRSVGDQEKFTNTLVAKKRS